MDYTCYILAGGKSSRMGTDKGLVTIDGKPMVQHIITEMQQLNMPIYIVTSNRAYEQFKLPIIKDIIPEKGPLGGILTALSHSKTSKNVLLSCDTPFLTKHIIEKLLLESVQSEITISKFNDKLHPLIGIYDTNLKNRIENEINLGHLKLIRFCEKSNLNIVTFEKGEQNISDHTFSNINTQEDLKNNQPRVVNTIYFGLIAEKTGINKEAIKIISTSENINLREFFESRYPKLKNVQYKIAVNQEFIENINTSQDINEIALLPPFAGG